MKKVKVGILSAPEISVTFDGSYGRENARFGIDSLTLGSYIAAQVSGATTNRRHASPCATKSRPTAKRKSPKCSKLPTGGSKGVC